MRDVPLSVSLRSLLIGVPLALSSFQAGAAEVDCNLPGRNTPAVPVPECVLSDGEPVACSDPAAIRLWPQNFSPASGIPAERDSTGNTGFAFPGWLSGFELFYDVHVVSEEGAGKRLYVAYNAGLQVWNIEAANAVHPVRLAFRDGWEGHFLDFPMPDEVTRYIDDVAAVSAGESGDLVALSGSNAVGPSLWVFDGVDLQQLYQEQTTDARQVRIVEHGGIPYAVAGGPDGVAVFDFSAALALSDPCLDVQGNTCPGVYQGTLSTGARFVDVLETAGGILMSTSSGVFTTLKLWWLDPTDPAASVLLYEGEIHAQGSDLFEKDGHVYLAWISEALGLDDERLKIALVDSCVSGGPCAPVEALVPMEVAPGAPTSRDFVTFSEAGGRPYLYYGVAAGAPSGPDLDQLFDLSALDPAALPLATLPEVTAGGGSYTDPCNGSEIRYWSHYYHANARGLRNMDPRVGQFSPEGYFYRAGSSILDVHFLGVTAIFADGFESGDTTAWNQ